MLFYNFFFNVIVSAKTVPQQRHFHRVVVFGDSLNDAGIASVSYQDQSGNNNWIQSQARHGSPVTNQNQQFLSPLWVNVLVKKLADAGRLDAGPLLWPVRLLHESANKKQQEDSVNVDYAYAGAGSGFGFLNDRSHMPFPLDVSGQCRQPGLFNGLSCIPGQLQQMTYFFKNHPDVDPSNLYIIWAGANDFFSNILKVPEIAKQNGRWLWIESFGMIWQTISTQMRPQSTGGLYYQRPVANVIEAARLLHQHGVNRDHMLVMGLPDMTLTPYLTEGLRDKAGLRVLIRIMSYLYNWQLRQNVSQYADFFSTYSLLTNIIHNNKHFIYHSVSCVDKKQLPFCKGFIFYDYKHITVAAGDVLASKVNDFL